jgi:hypothetical protein
MFKSATDNRELPVGGGMQVEIKATGFGNLRRKEIRLLGSFYG